MNEQSVKPNKPLEKKAGSAVIAKAIALGCLGESYNRISMFTGIPRTSVKRHLMSTIGPSLNGKGQKRVSGCESPSWKNGTSVTSRGYVCEQAFNHPMATGGYVFQHILVMEKHLGRFLERAKRMTASCEVVHHINGNRSDNRIENLQLMSFAAHTSLHLKGTKRSPRRFAGVIEYRVARP